MLPWKNEEEFVKEAEKVDFGKETIEAPPMEEYQMDLFCVEVEWKDNVEVELPAITGTVHPDYQGRTWLWLLKHGKRMKINLDLLMHNPGYYFLSEKKMPSMSYLQIGKKYYVYSDGNHRTCIAKFLFFLLQRKLILSGVEIYRKRLDFEAYRAWKKLGGYEGMVHIERKKINREDGPGWMREHYDLRFGVFKGRRCYRNLTSNELIEMSRERSFLTRVRTWSTKLFRY